MCICILTAMQRQKAVSAYFTSEKIMPFAFTDTNFEEASLDFF